jgi:hypothetical protein
MSIEQYIAKIDRIVIAKVGLSVHDLPDVPFYDWYEDMVPPAEAAREALEYADYPADLL